jgi:hypothetical protein
MAIQFDDPSKQSTTGINTAATTTPAVKVNLSVNNLSFGMTKEQIELGLRAEAQYTKAFQLKQSWQG